MLTPIMFSYEPYCYNGYTDLVKIQGHLGKLTKRLIFSFMLMFISQNLNFSTLNLELI